MHQIDMHLQKCRIPWIPRAILGRTLLMLAAAALVLSPNSAHADEPHYRVELSVAKNLPACDRQTDFTTILTTILGKPLLDPPHSRLFDVRVAKAPTGAFLVDLVSRELDGKEIESTHHEFPGDLSCFEVLYKAALRTAIRIELAAPEETAPEPASPPPCPSPATPPQCPTCEKPKPEPPKPAPIERHWFIGAGGMTSFGIAPEIVGGGMLVGGWRWSPSWSIEATASATIPQDTRPAGPTIVRVQTVFSASLAPCFRGRIFGACGIVGWDHIWLERRGAVWSDDQPSDSVRVGMRGIMEHHFANRWSARVNVDLALPIVRSNIRDDTQGIRWRMPPITGSIGGAVVVSF